MREAARKTRLSTGSRNEEQAAYQAGDNIFADLGRPNADELLAKAELARTIRHLIAARGLTQAIAAGVLGISQPDVSNLHRGRLAGFSMERLYRFLNSPGQAPLEVTASGGARCFRVLDGEGVVRSDRRKTHHDAVNLPMHPAERTLTMAPVPMAWRADAGDGEAVAAVLREARRAGRHRARGVVQ